jgi:hemin uptake protein HemP
MKERWSQLKIDDVKQAKSVRLRSEVLFGSSSEVIIEHGTEEYRLRRTRQGKLILTK